MCSVAEYNRSISDRTDESKVVDIEAARSESVKVCTSFQGPTLVYGLQILTKSLQKAFPKALKVIETIRARSICKYDFAEKADSISCLLGIIHIVIGEVFGHKQMMSTLDVLPSMNIILK